jgi:hypothetical protein
VFGGVMNADNNQNITIRVDSGPIVLLDSGYRIWVVVLQMMYGL